MNRLYVLFTVIFIGFFSEAQSQLTDPGRGMYVNRFFRTSTNQSGNLIVDPNYSILGIAAKEDSLLTYALNNHITYLILYDVHRVLGNATYENLLCSFIEKAKTNYCINKVGIASSCEALYDNVASVTPSDPYTFTSPNYPASLSFVQNYYAPGDSMFYLAEATKLGLRASTYNDVCNFKIDIMVTEFEFWNSGTDNCTGQTLTKDQKYQNYQSMITYMDAIRDHYNSNHTHQMYVETYLGYLSQNTAYTHQTIANWIDGSYNGKRRVDRILLHYYSANAVNLYSRTSSGANYSGYYLTRFVDFAQNTTNPNSIVSPIFSSEHTAWGAGSNFMGAWFNLNLNNNIFTAEKIWYNEWYADATTYSPSLIGNPTYGNTINPGGAIWFTSFYMLNHLERPVLFTSNSPICVAAGQNGAFQFQYQGPIEQGASFSFYLTDANDTTLRCGTRAMQNWPLYDGATQTSIDLNAALNGCTLPVGNYDAHLELNYANSCSTYFAPVARVSVVTTGQIVALTPTTNCTGHAIYLQASSTGGGTSTYLWYKGNQSVSGATSQSYAPTSNGSYSCRITSSDFGCSANRTSTIPVTINNFPASSISVLSSTSCSKILKANPTNASYLWPDGSTGSNYTALKGGYYSVFVTQNGCKSVASYSFTNVEVKVKEFNGSCTGMQNGSLKADISNGTGPYTISWSGPVNGSESNLSSGNYLIENLGAGTYTIVVTDASGCTASIQTLVPSAAGTVILASSNSPLCTGQTLLLTSSGGVTYSWIGPNNFAASVNDTSIANTSLAAGGDYTVTVTNANGCTASLTLNVIISTAFVVDVTVDTVCAGGDLHLASSSGTSYSWTGPAGFNSTLQSPVVSSATNVNAGQYTVVVSDASGCTASASVNAILFTPPQADATSSNLVCQGDNVQLFATGGNQYDWSGPNNFTSTQQDPLLMNVLPSDSGYYSVTITDSNACTNSDSTRLDVASPINFYSDPDGDGYGGGAPVVACFANGIYNVIVDGDCDENDSTVHPLAVEVCYNGIDENCNGMQDDSCSNVLHLTLFIEGFYFGNDSMIASVDPVVYPTLCDTIMVRLHSSSFPFQLISSVRSTIDVTGNGYFYFPEAVVGDEYYLEIRHRNALETWSKNPVMFSGSHVNYNFTLNANKAFGSNMKDLGDGNFALFSGDVNHDGIINDSDINLFIGGVFEFNASYSFFDLTGDWFIESADFALLENNLNSTLSRP